MNAQMIPPIVQQTASVLVAIGLLYGLQKLIKGFDKDQKEAIERARSLRRQAYRHSLEVLSGLDPECIYSETSPSSQSVKGMSINRRSPDMHPDIQPWRCPPNHLAAEASSRSALAVNFKVGLRD